MTMSRATSDDQLRFLLSCVKHATNGRVDFVEVAKECGVVSKGAAAKRYERLMKANGVSSTSGSAISSASRPPPSKQKAKSSDERPAAAKKQRLEKDNPASPSKRVGNGSRPITVTTAESQRDAGKSTPAKPEAFIRSVRHTLAGPTGLPQLSLPTTTFVSGNPVAQGVPYSGRQRSPFVGFPAIACGAGHQLLPDVSMYPPFPPVFRESWAFASQENGGPISGFDAYGNQDYVNQQNQAVQPPFQTEAIALRLPPQPQEVVPIQKQGERQPEEEGSAPKSKGHVVVVE
ncbi:hypothetical protein CLAIMM_04391 [Cladophialophora immunda]|nr:hypothetical protein CLAIMM_04391 [Cladophialophora immunda]